ncbi:hypothetical protein DWG18_07730 [Lysobacter sp. TY2-98]|uniref:hypothetical protein n=1 Tax=Lysobacter sp. TY2-98 TaxID=2290922 RepID=UPI000E20A735|nr:hypothetical protein [Lysobacter sp. TY2-98]AXK72182.1 hypothetical protein DWG18_07730 [Lysobacter sp. TY2-98]
MGKAIVYLIGVAVSLLLLWSTGLVDGMFDRGNLKQRDAFWRETIAKEAPTGTSKDAVDALVGRYGMSLECFHSSLDPPIADCMADDPASKGGTRVHPVALELRFIFHGDTLARFETNWHALK